MAAAFEGALEAFWKDDFGPLEAAGKQVLEALRDDEAAPDADLYRRIVSSGPGSHLYFPSPTLAHRRSVPLPPYLAQQLQSTRISSLMGLLPEADLVWMSVDERLFLWSSNVDSTAPGGMEDFCSFTVPSGQCVVSVGIVRPKKGVFKDMVEWCLIVTTPEEVILCALARSQGEDSSPAAEEGFVHGRGTLRLVPTRYILPTDSIPLLSVCGTVDGRIFMGGYDGCLYEMTYEALLPSSRPSVSLEERLDQFYDGDAPIPDLDSPAESSVVQAFAAIGKRALSSIMPPSSDPSNRPRKCRKLNHSSTISSLASAVVPDFLIKASSAVFGGKNSTGGGSILKIIHDLERSCLYTLSTRGWICAFDTSPSNLSGQSVKLTAVMDSEKTASLYLEAVSRGRMYPPSSSHSATLGNITFPGGGPSAQAGVGGMDGARSILKLADSAMKRGTNGRKGSTSEQMANVLTPIAIHVVPRRESGRLTLMAITAGGLRYYLSSLSSSAINSGRPGEQNGVNRRTDPLAPSVKFTLCHIRAPPPVGETGLVEDLPSFDSDVNGGVEGFVPRVPVRNADMAHVDSAYYGDGVMLLALEHKTHARNATAGSITPTFLGDIIIGSAPDSVARKKTTTIENGKESTHFSAPGGVSETLSLPLKSPSPSSADVAPILPGGRVHDIASSTPSESSLLRLALHSQTPSDSELGVGIVPSYIPPSKLRVREAISSNGDSRSSALVPRSETNTSVVLALMKNFLLSRPLAQGLTYQSDNKSMGGHTPLVQRGTLYRMSARAGCNGFSASAGEKSSRLEVGGAQVHTVVSSASQSARLSPWLLQPGVAPLKTLAIHHLLPCSGMIALNSGGMHFFTIRTVLMSLADALMAANASVSNDDTVTKFFTSYGYAQGCAMCLSLAVGCGPSAVSGGYSDELKSRARRAALSRAFFPRLVPKDNPTNDGTSEELSPLNTDPAIPSGYDFRPSSLSQGLTKLASRLLRPVWCKPGVVVTEGKTIKARAGSLMTFPAKVELLLDDATLEDVKKPLQALEFLMKDVFSPAVSVVPGVQPRHVDRMDVDGDTDVRARSRQGLISGAMLYNGQIRSHNESGPGTAGQLTARDAEAMARLLEEKNLHCLYRLVSRTVQVLTLLSLLKRAHYMPEMCGVEWGQLHGLTIAQLVKTQGGQQRIERLLNFLVSRNTLQASGVKPSADADHLANLLASECYLYFSPGARFAYSGFRAANEALACAPSSARRAVLTNQAVSDLKRAARYWCNAPLITGRILHSQVIETYSDIALKAIQYDSPLAKAAAVLIQLREVAGVVDLCLTTASNFGGHSEQTNIEGEALAQVLPWELNLYHKQVQYQERGRESASIGGASSSALVIGADVTAKDALQTCYAIILHHLSTLLDSSDVDLAFRMIDACARSCDQSFLHRLYDHLLSTNHIDALLKVESKDLEKWLRRPTMDAELLWQYYREHGKDGQAGQVMWKDACSENPDKPLEVRIQGLRKALSSYTVALEKRKDAMIGYTEWGPQSAETIVNREELQRAYTEINETLDVATLQNRMLRAISSSSLEATLDARQLSRLKFTLIPVSDLYNDYAAPLNLFDICLLILHSCRHDDPMTIQTLWRSILCEELFPCSTRSVAAYEFLQSFMAGSMLDETVTLLSQDGMNGAELPLFENGDWVIPLKGRVVSLGKELYGNGADYAFPVDFLASSLEGLRQSQLASDQRKSFFALDKPWPLQVLAEVGVPFLAAFQAYDVMVGRQEKELMGGADPERRLLHLACAVNLLSEWVIAASHGRMGNGSANTALKELADAMSSGVLSMRIDSFKNALEGMIGTREGDDVSIIYERLKLVEGQIRRIV